MSGQLDVNDPHYDELINRIVVRMGDQSTGEITHVLKVLSPNSPILRIKSVAEDLADKRLNGVEEFKNLLSASSVDMETFNALSSADQDPSMVFSRSQYDPTKFEITLECARTPFKEFFDECREISCEDCIKSRITNFKTSNENSTHPWTLRVDKVEGRRVNLCKNCGKMLDRKDDINLQNERMLYTCSYCGHKGWNKAK